MSIPISCIIPNQEIDMGRPRYTLPTPKPTNNKRGPKYVIRPMIDVIEGTEIVRRERSYYSPAEVTTMKAALKWRDEICGKLNHRPEIIQAQTRFADVIAAYRLNFLPALKPNTQLSYDVEIRTRIEPEFADARLCDIDPMRCQKWANWMAAKGWRAKTMQLALTVFRSIWEVASDWGYTTQRCPVSKRIRVSADKPESPRRAVTVEELQRLRAVFASGRKRRKDLGLAVDLCAFAGLRIGEVAALQRRHLDYLGGTITVSDSISRDEKRTSAKSTARTVAMGSLRDDLLRLCPPAAPADSSVFGVSRGIIIDTIRYAFVQAGITIPGAGAHLLRRFYATHARTLASISDVQQAMGHATEGMTQHYITRTVAEQARVTDALRASVMGGTRGTVN